MEFYKNMCDGELLAFYRAAKRSASSLENLEAEIAKMEKEMRDRKLNTDNLKPFRELEFYVSRMSGKNMERSL